MHKRDPEAEKRRRESTDSASRRQKLIALFAALIMVTSIMIGLADYLMG